MIIDPDTITLALATLALMVPSFYDGSLFTHARLESRAFENSACADEKDILYSHCASTGAGYHSGRSGGFDTFWLGTAVLCTGKLRFHKRAGHTDD